MSRSTNNPGSRQQRMTEADKMAAELLRSLFGAGVEPALARDAHSGAGVGKKRKKAHAAAPSHSRSEDSEDESPSLSEEAKVAAHSSGPASKRGRLEEATSITTTRELTISVKRTTKVSSAPVASSSASSARSAAASSPSSAAIAPRRRKKPDNAHAAIALTEIVFDNNSPSRPILPKTGESFNIAVRCVVSEKAGVYFDNLWADSKVAHLDAIDCAGIGISAEAINNALPESERFDLPGIVGAIRGYTSTTHTPVLSKAEAYNLLQEFLKIAQPLGHKQLQDSIRRIRRNKPADFELKIIESSDDKPVYLYLDHSGRREDLNYIGAPEKRAGQRASSQSKGEASPAAASTFMAWGPAAVAGYRARAADPAALASYVAAAAHARAFAASMPMSMSMSMSYPPMPYPSMPMPYPSMPMPYPSMSMPDPSMPMSYPLMPMPFPSMSLPAYSGSAAGIPAAAGAGYSYPGALLPSVVSSSLPVLGRVQPEAPGIAANSNGLFGARAAAPRAEEPSSTASAEAAPAASSIGNGRS